MKPLEKEFWDELGELLHAEEMLMKALLRMDTAANDPAMKGVLVDYREVVQKQSAALREIFEHFEMPAREKKCEGMMGLLVKAQQLIQRSNQGATLDCALLASCLKVTSWKLVSYQTLFNWSKLLDDSNAKIFKRLDQAKTAEQDFSEQFGTLAEKLNTVAASELPRPLRKPPASARTASSRAEAGFL